MWPFNAFKKEETKSNIRTVDISNDDSLNDILPLILGISSGSPTNIQPREAYNLSERNSDLGGAIKKISTSTAMLKLQIKEPSGEIRTNDPLLDLLNNPGESSRKIQFMYEITESMLLTNELYIVARGNINREPLSIVAIRPYNVSITMDHNMGMPLMIETQCDKDRRVYYREIIKGEIRYIDKTGLNEIFPIIGVSNTSDEWRGRSPLAKLFYDVKMNTDGKRHNTSLLQNGMKTSSIITPDGTTQGGAQAFWNEETVKKIQEYIRTFNQGAGNAGNNLILSQQAKILGLTQNNKDMDFFNLLKISREAIYNLYEIPLPLIMSDAMTLSNYSVAFRAFFDNAVTPVFNNIADGIMNAMAPRFNSINEGDELTFSEVDVNALRTVLVENMKLLKETEAISTNEVRSVGGYEPDPAGDEILVSSNKIPLLALDIGPSFEDIPDDTEPTED